MLLLFLRIFPRFLGDVIVLEGWKHTITVCLTQSLINTGYLQAWFGKLDTD